MTHIFFLVLAMLIQYKHWGSMTEAIFVVAISNYLIALFSWFRSQVTGQYVTLERRCYESF